MIKNVRRLQDLTSVGPATMRDFKLIGIRTVDQLTEKNPRQLYRQLCQRTGRTQDICCLDVFAAAIAQAKDPDLPIEQRHWWYWSKKRKAKYGSR